MREYRRWLGEIAGYAQRKCAAYARQLAGQYDVDDLMQEAFLVFDKAVAKYGELVKSERHFMGIYKRCLFNRFWSLERDMKSAARRGCGGFWLGEHDREVLDKHHDEVCLDDEPEVIRWLKARIGVDGNQWYRGRRFIAIRQKRNEPPLNYLRRVVGGDEKVMAIALAYMGIEDE